MMDTNEILARYDREVRIAFTPTWGTREACEYVIRHLKPPPAGNFIAYCHCTENQVDQVIEEQVSYLTSLGQPFAWVVFDHDQPANLKERLAAGGLALDAVESFMVLDLQAPPASLLAPVAADVRRLTKREQLGDITSVMQAVWGGDPALRLQNFGYDLDLPGYLSMYVGYVEGKPASAGRIHFFTNSRFAAIRGGCTLPEYRQHGLYTAILAARAQEAIQRGYRYLVIEASEMSAPIAARHGFQFLEYLHTFKEKAS